MHKHLWFKRALITAAVGTFSAGAFYAGVAYAADPRLDQANDNIVKAIALLEAAQNPNGSFGGHRRKAVQNLKQAQSEIQKAKQFADNPKNKGKGDKDKD
jgi:hypothetical protein